MKQTYFEWMRKVDKLFENQLNVDIFEIEEVQNIPFEKWYNKGCSPESTVEEILGKVGIIKESAFTKI